MLHLDRWIDNKLTQNLFIWFFLFLILLTTIQADARVISALFAILLLAPPVYLNNLLILPFFKRKPFIFLFLFIINSLVFTGISVFAIQMAMDGTFEWGMFINFFGIMILAMTFASAIKLARDSFTRRQQEKEAELKLLKAQLNPHFLFNTLNNLYGLSVIKSNKLPDLMLKLSDLLRYSLYETKESLVPLDKEVQYLENYIALEKIRLEDQTEISFTKTSDFSKKNIAPMLLIVFVENAFKHLGVLKDKTSRVEVKLILEGDTLTFECSNSINKIGIQQESMEKGKSGIGLQNAKKRLALIYPTKHDLKVNHESDIYAVKLKLHL